MVLLDVNQHKILFVKVNDAATAAPTVTDDTNAGYSLGSHWIDITNDEIYFLTDPAAGAAVWRRAVGSTGGEIVHTVETGIVASVTQTQAGATVLTGERVEVITVANTDDAVRVPSASGGRDCLIFNSGANRLQVFPAASDSIDNLSVNLSVTINPNTATLFSAVSATSWYTAAGLIDQLEGNLDVNGFQIVSSSNGNILIMPNGTGNVSVGTDDPISIFHIRELDIGVTAAHTSQAPHGYLSVEDEDARLGLFSNSEGGHGSTISLVEVNAGVYQDQWAIGRLSSGSGSTLVIEYGTNTQYGTNTDLLTITTAGDVAIGAATADGILHLDNGTSDTVLVIEKDGNTNGRIAFHSGGAEWANITFNTGERLIIENDFLDADILIKVNVGGVDTTPIFIEGTNGFVGIGNQLSAQERLQVNDSISISNTAEGGTARLTRRTTREAHTLAAASTSDTTTISIPSGARLLAVSFNVNTAVVDDGGDDTWSAAFVTGSTTTLATAAAAAQNTKVNLILPDEISTGVCEIRFTANGGNFSAGVIEIVAYYEELTSLANV